MSQFHRRNADNGLTAGRAREALRLIQIPASPSVDQDTTSVPDSNHTHGTLPATDFFDHLEIYPGSKIAHFKQFHKITGIPYSEMVGVLPSWFVSRSIVLTDLADSSFLMTN